jgi:DNA-binding NarL/FixJ family response regulator
VLIRLLVATPDGAPRQLFESLLARALELTPIDVAVACAASQAEVIARAEAACDDVIVIDWLLAHEETPALVRALLAHNGRLRIVVLLPAGYRQYRREVWLAGACSSIAREHMEQEWLSGILCLMHRAMQREARLIEALTAAGVAIPVLALAEGCCRESEIDQAACCTERGVPGRLSFQEGSPNGKG